MVPDFQATQDSPLSLQGEGWGEGALNPNTYAPGKPLREQARSYEERLGAACKTVAPTLFSGFPHSRE